MIRTSVVVLHRYPYSESSYVVKAISPSQGLVSFLVKGVKRKGSPFRASLDPLAFSEVVYQPSMRSELHIPREAHLLRYHTQLRQNLFALAQAQVMAECVLRISQHGAHFQEEFELLCASLHGLEHNPVQPSALVFFLAELCERLGIGLRMDSCVQCQSSFSERPADIWPALGGCICQSCLGERSSHWSGDFLSQLYSFSKHQFCGSAPERLEYFYLSYLRIHSGYGGSFRSHQWLEELRGHTPKENPDDSSS